MLNNGRIARRFETGEDNSAVTHSGTMEVRLSKIMFRCTTLTLGPGRFLMFTSSLFIRAVLHTLSEIKVQGSYACVL